MGLPIESVIAGILSQWPERSIEKNKESNAPSSQGIQESLVDPSDTLLERHEVVSMLNGGIESRLRDELDNRLQSSPKMRDIADNLAKQNSVDSQDIDRVLEIVQSFLKA